MKKVILIAVVGLILSFVFNYAYTQERITLSTYYPAPYGEYRKLAIGSSTGGYTAPTSDDIDLVVEGNVGIGTTNPIAKLEVNSPDDSVAPALYIRQNNAEAGYKFWLDTLVDGDLTIEGINAGANTDILTLERLTGNVGIGTTDPGTNRLEVVGGPVKATGGLIIQTVGSQAEEDAMTKVTGQSWLRTDINP